MGLKQVDEKRWKLKFSFRPLGILDEGVGKVLPVSPVFTGRDKNEG
jgi:hypothetical protein